MKSAHRMRQDALKLRDDAAHIHDRIVYSFAITVAEAYEELAERREMLMKSADQAAVYAAPHSSNAMPVRGTR